MSEAAHGERPAVVAILSSNYSGSHLLARYLGAHPGCANVGELRNLHKFLAHPSGNVSGVESRFGEHPVFAGLTALPSSQWHEVLLQRVGEADPSVTTIIDNSKRPDWARMLIASGRVEVRFVHLLRDPRAIAWRAVRTLSDSQARTLRWREAKRRPGRGLRIAGASRFELHGWRWLRENEVLRRATAGSSSLRVGYEELTSDPAAVLRRLMPALGLSFDASQLKYWEAEELGTRKTAWSAPGAQARGADLAWRDEMSVAQQAEVVRIPPLRRFIRESGFCLGESGLERVTAM